MSKITNNIKANKSVYILIGTIIGLSSMLFGIRYLTEKTSNIYDIRVTNITGTSATVTWVSDSPVKGSVIYSQSDSWFPVFEHVGKARAYDDRDIEEVEYGKYELEDWGEYYVHHVTLRNLEPDSKYYYKVSTGLKSVNYDYPTLETVGVIDELKDPHPIYGRVVDTSNELVGDVLVFVHMEGFKIEGEEGVKSQVLSTVTNGQNGWSLDIATARSDDFVDLFEGSQSFTLSLDILAQEERKEGIIISGDQAQPVDDIILIGKGIDSEKSASNGLVSKVSAAWSECESLSAFKEGCKRGEPSPGAWNCDGLTEADWRKWKEENPDKCGGTTSPPETPTTTPEAPSTGDDCNGWKPSYWGGNGAYCNGETLCNCNGINKENASCTKVKSCEYGCFENDVGKPSRCYTKEEVEKGEGEGEGEGEIPEGWKPSYWGGEGTYCNASDLYNCTGTSITDASCSKVKTCVNGCYENEPGKAARCYTSSELGEGSGGDPGEFGKPENVERESGYDAGSFGWKCGNDGYLWYQKPGEETWNKSSIQRWCGDGCPQYAKTPADECTAQSQSTCTCKRDTYVPPETTLTPMNKCVVGSSVNRWSNVATYPELEERITSDLLVGQAVKKIVNSTTYLVVCNYSITPGEIPPTWEVKILSTEYEESCAANPVLAGWPEDQIVRDSSGNRWVCVGGKSILITDHAADFESACKGILDNKVVEYGGRWYYCNAQAVENRTYYSYTGFPTEGDECVLVAGSEDCRSVCIEAFGVCNKKHGETCNIVSAADELVSNCMYGFNCKDSVCKDPNHDSDGDGIPDSKDEAIDDPCVPYATEGCSPDTAVGLAPTDLDVIYVTGGEGRSELVSYHVTTYYDPGLLAASNYDPQTNTSDKEWVWIHQTSSDTDGSTVAGYWANNVVDDKGNLVPYAHVIIDKDGTIIWVASPDQVALHAGQERGNIVGIAIENVGESGEEFTDEQVDSMVALLTTWEETGVIEDKCRVVGHSEIALENEEGVRYNNPDPGLGNMIKLREALECEGEEPVGELNNKSSSVKGLMTSVKAEEGKKVEFEITNNVLKLSDDSVIFWDYNHDGKRDEFEKSARLSEIDVEISNATIIDLNKGWNAIGIPLYTDTEEGSDVTTAQALLDKINSQGFLITHVAAFREGQWKMYTKRAGVSYSEDYEILPGEGYMVKVYDQGKLVLKGRRFEESVPLDLRTGWNLVSVVVPDANYTADSLIDAIIEDGINADTVTKWDSGRYSNFIKEGDLSYGNDFRIFETGGYFLRVKSEGGRFVP